MHILRCYVYGFKILCEISKVPFEISHKILNPYTAKYEFYEVLKTFKTTQYPGVMTSQVSVRRAPGMSKYVSSETQLKGYFVTNANNIVAN